MIILLLLTELDAEKIKILQSSFILLTIKL